LLTLEEEPSSRVRSKTFNDWVDLRAPVDSPRTAENARSSWIEEISSQRPISPHDLCRRGRPCLPEPAPEPAPGFPPTERSVVRREEWTRKLQRAASIFLCCGGCAGDSTASSSSRRSHPCGEAEQPCAERSPHRRWYKLHPVGDGQFSVRPDAGRRASAGIHLKSLLDDDEAQADLDVFDARLNVGRVFARRRSRSSPSKLERRWCLAELPGLTQDAFTNCCRICYDRAIEVVLLPCGHGVMCEECLRRHFFSRPVHRGGRSCPLCRKFVREVLWIFNDVTGPQYGFAIKTC